MALEFVEKRRGRANMYRWIPFEVSHNFTAGWWEYPAYRKPDRRFVQVLQDGVEVGRVEFDNKVGLRHYGVDPQIECRALDRSCGS
jgi:hypothetical protein